MISERDNGRHPHTTTAETKGVKGAPRFLDKVFEIKRSESEWVMTAFADHKNRTVLLYLFTGFGQDQGVTPFEIKDSQIGEILRHLESKGQNPGISDTTGHQLLYIDRKPNETRITIKSRMEFMRHLVNASLTHDETAQIIRGLSKLKRKLA